MELRYTSRTGYELSKAHSLDAGYDLPSAENVTLAVGEARLVDTGLNVQVPPGTVGDVRTRSGLAAKHGVIVRNSPGTIDAGYTGKLMVNLKNDGNTAYHITKGDRIAQLVVLPLAPIGKTVKADELANPGDNRGDGGHGSSGY